MKISTPKEILHYWFGEPTDANTQSQRQQMLWWSKDVSVDSEIRRLFLHTTMQLAKAGETGWSSSAHAALAEIICLDQFPRNMFRDRPEAFAYDWLALQYAEKMVHSGLHKALDPLLRVFAYLPFEHAESMQEQDKSLMLFAELRNEVSGEFYETFDGFYDFAKKHAVIIERFGRFPHRNDILGRTSTEQERIFLTEPDSSF